MTPATGDLADAAPVDVAPAAGVRLLAVASKGGHWEQLMLLRPAFGMHDVHYATTDQRLALREGLSNVFLLPDANRDSPGRALSCFVAALRVVLEVRPQIIVTTGALPGLLCVVAGRCLGARTLWIDSFANSERLSTSGKWARLLATRSLTQWPHLADPRNMGFEGSLL